MCPSLGIMSLLRQNLPSAHREIIFQILLNNTDIRLYLPFSDWFETKRTSVWFQINRKMVNIIWFRFDLIRFRKCLSVCVLTDRDLSFFLNRLPRCDWKRMYPNVWSAGAVNVCCRSLLLDEYCICINYYLISAVFRKITPLYAYLLTL